jgi:hypothetical protein
MDSHSLSEYRISIRINAGEISTSANAHVYDAAGNRVLDAQIKIDGIELKLQPHGGYFSSLDSIWQDGSKHYFSIATDDGARDSGELFKPVGTLSDVVYAPTKPTVASSYTVSPPSGQWPAGSYVMCTISKSSRYFGEEKDLSGSDTGRFSGPIFDGADSVSFSSALRNRYEIPRYAVGSSVSVIGNETIW